MCTWAILFLYSWSLNHITVVASVGDGGIRTVMLHNEFRVTMEAQRTAYFRTVKDASSPCLGF